MAQISIDYSGWPVVIALGLSLVAIGAIADILVKKDEIKWLHSKLLRLSEALTQIPLREWQVKIARAGIGAVGSVQGFGLSFLMSPIRLLQGGFKRLPLLNNDRRSSMAACLCGPLAFGVLMGYLTGHSLFAFLLFFPVCTVFVLWSFYIFSDIGRIELVFLFPGLIAWFVILVLLKFGCNLLVPNADFIRSAAIWFAPVFLVLLCGGFISTSLSGWFNWFPTLFMNALIISAILSGTAFMVASCFIPSPLLNTYWYEIGNDVTILNKLGSRVLLYFVNYSFDLATIAVSILLLRFVVKHKRFIGFVAVVDIVISGLLTVMLYSFLLLSQNRLLRIENSSIDKSHFHVHFVESFHWFKDVIVGVYQAAKYNEPFAKHLAGLRDIHLLPLLLTTFVPVSLYMSVFLFISFCKPVLKLASRIFGVIGEKEELVFKQFGFLIGAIMAAVKAIYDVLKLF